MGGDALQIAAVHAAMAATAYLTNIMSCFLNGKPTQMGGPSLGLGSRLEARPRFWRVSMSRNGSEALQHPLGNYGVACNTRNDPSRRMGSTRSAPRLLDPENPHVLLETVEKAATAVGKRLTIGLTDAPRAA